MLHARINLIKTYLSDLPPSYLTDSAQTPSTDQNEPNHVLLRQISALLSRLPLLAPQSLTTDSSQTNIHTTPQSEDVNLVSLLSTLTKTVAASRELTNKSGLVTRARNDRKLASMARGGDGTESLGRGGRGGVKDMFDGDAGFDSGADGGEY